MRLELRSTLACAAMLALTATGVVAQQSPPTLDSSTLNAFRWRSIGPANMGGRVSDVVGIPSPSKTFYVAAAAGGVWKTTNAGTTFQPVFDHERVASMGALAIAPSDTNQVWAGTGEQNSRNSLEPGGGIYKSADGGKTWKSMGLVETQQIARIVVHPTDPNIVYVAALGHAWGSNKERGLYKTTDGGATWTLAKFISDKAGFIDVAMDPREPNTLYASSYERQRGPYFLQSGGPGSALWKTTDAGATWSEIKGGGFPATMKGRIGLAVSRSNPRVVYALVEADSVRGAKAPYLVALADAANANASKSQRLLSGLYRSTDGGQTWRWMNGNDVRPFYYSQVRVDPKDENRVYWSSTPVNFSTDGGKTVRTATVGIHVDHHAMWIDPNDPEHFIVGDDGGVSQTWDKGGNYDFMNSIALGQFYEVSYDMAVPYRVCGGLQDNNSWCGPSRKKGPITNADWFAIPGGDGFYTAQDQTNPNIIYSESQGGNVTRTDFATGERAALVKPSWRPVYTQIEDSILVARGDTTKPAPRDVEQRVSQYRAQQKTDSLALDMRFNWNTPFFLSAHSPTTFYMAGNRVLKSTNRGEDLHPISPDLSNRDTTKIRVSLKTTGGITNDATGAETYATVVALAESPIRPGILFAGTDDGNVWVTKNDGAAWDNLTGRFPGVPKGTYVVRIEPSHFDSTTFYIGFDNHRNNDFAPYLFVTTDFGKTFRPIANNLPTGGPDFVHVIREDPVNRDLLFVGTSAGVYTSLDRGRSWQKFMAGLPTVPVHDLKIHPRDHELIAATHGRSIWIVDIAPLEQMTASVLTADAHLFQPKTAYQFGEPLTASGEFGHKAFEGQSAPYGADIAYRLASGNPRTQTKIVITDVRGDTLRTLNGPGGAGLHHVQWDFRGKAPAAQPLSPAGKRDSVVTQRKISVILDSIEKAGTIPKPTVDRIRTMVTSGGQGLQGLFGGGGGGRRAGAGGVFAARPGEGPLQGAGAGGGRGARGTGVPRDTAAMHAAMAGRDSTGRDSGAMPAGAATGSADDGAPIDQAVLGEVFQAFRAANINIGGFGGGGGGGGRGGPPLVPSGDYLVSVTAGGKTLRQVLRVERVNTPGTPTIVAGDDDPNP
ncbi:MAG: hypothetical protein ABJD07_07710 [Gemmatimonadaceae bacterium]